jgi:NAD(P)-dependent dehydrogenase (short-subunit alcohol dehydrogenase family)
MVGKLPSPKRTFESTLLGLEGKAAIVTGADGGIGSSATRFLSSLGVGVVAVDRRFKNSPKSVQGSVYQFVADVSESRNADKAVELCLEKFGRLDILVNNAGFIKGGSIFDYKDDDWERQLSVNLGGYRNFARAAAKVMIERKKGDIVNTSSVDGIMGEPGVLAYSSTKGAIIIFTKCLAMELAPYGIRVNSVAPGWVDTPMGGELLDARSRKVVNERIPLGYISSPDEIAKVIVFLASDMASYMTGSIVLADGGLTSDISIKGLSYS